jgi:hypothetical protein
LIITEEPEFFVGNAKNKQVTHLTALFVMKTNDENMQDGHIVVFSGFLSNSIAF